VFRLGQTGISLSVGLCRPLSLGLPMNSLPCLLELGLMRGGLGGLGLKIEIELLMDPRGCKMGR
jgi:hypothetical protein